MVTNSAVGALPLGIVITSDETTTTLCQAVDTLKECLPSSDAFFKQGLQGPRVFMTDNCSELRDALTYGWPSATLLLCIFHILQQVWRWLMDTSHGIDKSDRQELLLKFKRAMYTEDEVEFENLFSDMIESDCVTQYNKLVAYLSSLYEIKESWALCHRTHLMLRGSNTNNPAEAQFLVLKDDILNRTKEINVNGLMEKLIGDFNDHYKIKLLNVASGKFDGVYSRRFKGLHKSSTSKESQAFKIPASDQQEMFIRETVLLHDDVYLVPSLTDRQVHYTVDMNIGMCECNHGRDGSVCKHQYLLWAHKRHKTGNFVPYLSSEERRNFAIIAIGDALSANSYEGLHDRMRDSLQDASAPVPESGAADEVECMATTSSQLAYLPSEQVSNIDPSAQEYKCMLREAMEHIESQLECYDSNLLSGVVKFCNRVKTFQRARLASALHSFGIPSAAPLRTTLSSSLRKKRSGKISVQPESVKRRKSTGKSRRAIVKGMSLKKNPFVHKTTGGNKRSHDFSLNVANNEPVAKKGGGRYMFSRTKHHCQTQPLQCETVKTDMPGE